MPWDAVVWMNADQVVVWREPDRYKGDRDKVPDRIYYTATLPGRRKPEENEVRRVGLQVEPQVFAWIARSRVRSQKTAFAFAVIPL